MKIYPRRIRVNEDKLGYEFTIKNSSTDDRILLFRIRRAEEKLLTFAPKKGYIMPGETQVVQVTALSSHFDKTKLLVKLVVVPRVEVLQEFEQSWHIGETVGGEVKKIVDFFGTENHDADDHKSQSSRHSGGSSHRQHDLDRFSDVLSEASTFSFTSPSKAHSVRSSSEFKSQSEMSFNDALNDSFRSDASTLKMPTFSSAQPDFKLNSSSNSINNNQATVSLVDVLKILAVSQQMSGSSLVNQSLDSALSQLNVSADVAALVSLLQQPQAINNSQNNLSKISNITPEQTFRESIDSIASADLRSVVERHSVLKKSPSKNRASGDSLVEEEEDNEERELQHSIDQLSKMSATKLGSGVNKSNPNNLNTLEITGEEIDDSLLKKVVESRLVAAIKTREKIAAIEVSHTNLISLKTSISRVFEYQPSTGQQSADDAKEQLRSLQASYLEDQLRLLTVSHSRLLSVDNSINRFNNLTHIYLQHNRIRKIDNMLQLPYLQLLDLSYNQLTSLDFLQELHGLHSLHVVSNKISSITQSINMLIPLALNITTLDLSQNPVCQDFKYAEATILALPRLKYFDEVHIDSLYKHSYSSNAHNNGGNKSKFSSAASTMLSVENKRMRGKGKVALPSFPCQDKKQSTGDKQKDEFVVKLRRALGLRVYQSRRERLNPPPQEVESKSRAVRRSNPSSKQGYSFAEEESVASDDNQSQADDLQSVGEQYADDYNNNDYNQSYDYQQEQEQNHSYHQAQPTHQPPARQPQYQPQPHYQQQQHYQPPLQPVQPAYNYQPAPQPQAQQSRPTSAPPRIRPASQPMQVSPTQHTSYMSQSTPAKLNTSATSNNSSASNGKRTTSPKQFTFANVQTSGSKQRRKSQAVSLIQHWTGHKSELSAMDTSMTKHSPQHVREPPASPASSLLQPTGATLQRRKSFGTLNTDLANFASMNSAMQSPSSLSRGYFSDGDLSSAKKSCRGRAAAKLSQEKFGEMQEDERYSIWHPRYKVPKPVFGFSKPFLHRKSPDQIGYAPLFDKTVQRIRDGFEKLPTRGTFTRSSKGLTAEFYPMDYTDIEAIRRQGYFHETIGDIQKDSYKDLSSPRRANQSTISNSMEAIVNPNSGSVTLSPLKKGRRASIGQHVSRQYKSSFDGQHSMSTLNQPSDDFSGFRKWHHVEPGDEEKYDSYDGNAEVGVFSNSVFANTADSSNNNGNATLSPNSAAIRKKSVMSQLFGPVVVEDVEEEAPQDGEDAANGNSSYHLDSARSRKEDFSSFFDPAQSPHQHHGQEDDGLPPGEEGEEQQESAALVSYLSWLEEQQSTSQHFEDDDDNDHPMVVPLRHPRDLAMREAQREDSRPNSPGGSVGSGRNPMHILFRNNSNPLAGDTTPYI